MGHSRGRNAGPDADALPAENAGDQLACLRLLQRQQLSQRLDHRHLRHEAGKHLGKLGAERAAAQDQERAGDLLGLDSLPVGPVGSAG
jgi:hypothetical protein